MSSQSQQRRVHPNPSSSPIGRSSHRSLVEFEAHGALLHVSKNLQFFETSSSKASIQDLHQMELGHRIPEGHGLLSQFSLISLVSRPSYSGYSMCSAVRSRSFPSTSMLILPFKSSDRIYCGDKKASLEPTFLFPSKYCCILSKSTVIGTLAVGSEPLHARLRPLGNRMTAEVSFCSSRLGKFQSESKFHWTIYAFDRASRPSEHDCHPTIFSLRDR